MPVTFKFLASSLVLFTSVFSLSVFSSQKLDVNGDGNADILWRNQVTGKNWLWTMDGVQVSESKALNTISLDWEIVGRGDFDGDGKSDILWRNSESGRNYIYLMDGFDILQAKELNYIPDLAWKVKGVTDLNGDGKDDVIWYQEGTGRTWVYLLDGISITKSVGSQTVSDAGYQIVATGDINGDGRGDVIWRHATSGVNYIWQMNGSDILAQYVLNSASIDWNVVGTGDLDGNGVDDIIWRNSQDGRNWAYLMDSQGEIVSSKGINTISDQDWHIRTVGDLNGDGKADIFWRHQDSGKTYAYLMNGTSIVTAGFSDVISLDWQIISDSSVLLSEETPMTDDCANNSSTTCMLSLDGSAEGAIETTGDGDVFIVDVVEEGTLTVYSSGSTDVNGGLFETGNGNALLQDEDGGEGTNFSLTYEVTPKRYYIQVMGDKGAYTLTTEFTGETKVDDSFTYYQSNISSQIVQAKCILCHTTNGAASASRLHFTNNKVTGFQSTNHNVWQTFMNQSGVSSNYVLLKSIGASSHGGGPQLAENSDDYTALATYLGMID